MRLSAPTSRPGRESTSTAVSTDCNRQRCIATLTPVYIQPKDEPTLVETGESGGYDVRTNQAITSRNSLAGDRKTTSTGSRKTVCEVRGITLNYSASQLVNCEEIREMILKGSGTNIVTVHTDRNIKRKRADGRVSIVTEPEDKMYRTSFFKRST